MQDNKHTHTGALLFLVAIVALIALVYFLATPAQDSEQTSTPTTTTQTEDEQEGISFSDYSTSSEYYEITTDLPEEDSLLVGAAVVRSYLQSGIDEFADRAAEEAPEIAEQRDGEVIPYQQDVSVTAYENGEYTSYYAEDYRYTGGANGNTTVRTFIFDEPGLEVSEQIILADQQGAFLAAVKDELRQRDFAQNDTFGGIIDELSFNNLNFYLNESDEIVVAFSEYAVAPGAAGVVKVSLPQEPYIAQ